MSSLTGHHELINKSNLSSLCFSSLEKIKNTTGLAMEYCHVCAVVYSDYKLLRLLNHVKRRLKHNSYGLKFVYREQFGICMTKLKEYISAGKVVEPSAVNIKNVFTDISVVFRL